MKQMQDVCSMGASQEEKNSKGRWFKLLHQQCKEDGSSRVENMFAQLIERADAQKKMLREIKFDVIKIYYKVDQHSLAIQ